MNPIESYLAEKRASGIGDFVRGVGQGVRATALGSRESSWLPGLHPPAAALGENIGAAATKGLGAVAGGLALAGAGLALQSAHNAVTKARDFRAMLAANPDLAEAQAENPKLFNQMFSTLRTMNPAFSKEPLVAGHYMRAMTNDPMHAGALAVEVLEHRDKIRSPLMGAFSRGGGKK